MIGFDNKGYNPTSLTEEYSPSIPKDFPKDRIPKNLCEQEILTLFKCTKFISDRDACQRQYTDFIQCRNNRDIEIFFQIKQWEKQHLRDLSEQNRGFYLMGLGKKLERLEQEYEKIPTTYSYKTKAWTYKSDIDQIKWRIGYLNQEIKKIDQENKENKINKQ